MNWLDLVFAFILLWAVNSSRATGLIQEVFTLLGLGAGIILAGQLYAPLSRTLFGETPREIGSVVAFLAILLAVWFAVGFLGRLVRLSVRWMKFDWVDQFGGILFGLLKGLIIIEVLLVLFARFPVWNSEELIQGSFIASVVARFVPVVIRLLPDEFRRLTTILR